MLVDAVYLDTLNDGVARKEQLLRRFDSDSREALREIYREERVRVANDGEYNHAELSGYPHRASKIKEFIDNCQGAGTLAALRI